MKATIDRSRIMNLWRRHLRPMLIIILVLLSFRSSVADWNDVPTQSMEPTILAGERIVVNRLAYGLKVPFTTWHLATWAQPKRGDLIVFYAPDDGKRMVKRVIGVGGDRIAMRGNRVLINGQALSLQPAGAAPKGVDDLTDPPPHIFACERIGDDWHAVMGQPRRSAKRSFEELVVPADHVFVMGDNRDNSRDSRYWGFVERDEVLGRAFGIAFSLDRDEYYLPRWKRFFRSID
jgi:signal peptidase I